MNESALNVVLPGAASTIPPALSLNGNPSNMAPMRRQGVRQKSDVQTYTENSKIIINIPAGWVDFRDAFLQFYAIVTPGGAATYSSFSYPIHTMFERVRVYLGSKLLEDIDNYAVLAAMFHMAKPAGSNLDLSKGNQDDVARNVESIAGRSYSIRLDIESLEKIYPLHKISVPMRFELTVNSNDQFLETDDPASSFAVSQVYFHYHILQVSDAYDSAVQSKIDSGQYVIPMRSYHNYDNTNLTGASYNQELPFRYMSMNRILIGQRFTAEILNQTLRNKYFNRWKQNGIDTLSIRINNTTYPSDKYDLSQDPNKYQLFKAFCDTMNERYHCNFRFDDIIAAFQWGSTTPGAQKFFIAFDIRNNNADMLGETTLWGNGINTSNSGSTTILQLQLTGAPAQQTTVESFCQFEVFLKINPGGSVEIAF